MITTCTVNGIRIAYSDAGEGHSLLCLHGGMGVDRASLEVPGILRLADHQIRLLIPDLRGHGQSGTSSIEAAGNQVAAIAVSSQCTLVLTVDTKNL